MARTQQSWEVKLGFFQALVLLAVVVLSLLCAFYLGLFSGRNVGYEDALAANTSQLARLPISVEAKTEEEDERAVSEVYSKLKESSSKSVEGKRESVSTERNLAAIKTTDLAPLVDDLIPLPQADTSSAIVSDVDGKLEERSDDASKGNEKFALNKNKDDLAKINQAEIAKDKRASLFYDRVPSDSSGPKLGTLLEKQGTQKPNDQKKLEKPSVVEVAPEVSQDNVADRGKQVVTASSNGKVTGRISADVGFVRQTQESERGEPDSLKDMKEERVSINNEKESSFVKSVLPNGWFAQLAAPKQVADADFLAKQLRDSGFPVVIEKTVVRGEEYYRVLCGPEEKREHAEILINQLKRESYIKAEPFLRRVN